ncbi:hypothetical protein DSCW_53300 [Desulfosarcina widdelii]|uniref:Uncharacterized protein n=1 Tax=Desulfosarcina widdelii TaxID=947919 RepID=A0A5K7ZDY6_9BACT|nr:hypothetical protein DSCW_53300 [Desulfosarcina widdelii]
MIRSEDDKLNEKKILWECWGYPIGGTDFPLTGLLRNPIAYYLKICTGWLNLMSFHADDRR